MGSIFSIGAAVNWEVFLKRKSCIDDAQSARKKVAYVVGVKTVERAIEIALARSENKAFVLDGTPRRAAS